MESTNQQTNGQYQFILISRIHLLVDLQINPAAKATKIEAATNRGRANGLVIAGSAVPKSKSLAVP